MSKTVSKSIILTKYKGNVKPANLKDYLLEEDLASFGTANVFALAKNGEFQEVGVASAIEFVSVSDEIKLTVTTASGSVEVQTDIDEFDFDFTEVSTIQTPEAVYVMEYFQGLFVPEVLAFVGTPEIDVTRLILSGVVNEGALVTANVLGAPVGSETAGAGGAFTITLLEALTDPTEVTFVATKAGSVDVQEVVTL